MKYQLHQAAIVGTVILVLGGCAATADMDQLKTSVATAQSTADSAKIMAIDAKDTANRALSLAEQAMTAADRATDTALDAKGIAEQALAEARAASEKADRMYQKSISK